MTSAFPNALMVHTPVHASWLNQVEIYFSVVQRKVVSPDDFTDLAQVRDRLRAFEDRCNARRRPPPGRSADRPPDRRGPHRLTSPAARRAAGRPPLPVVCPVPGSGSRPGADRDQKVTSEQA
ncbi:hypothetical protein ACFU98_25090 [Streptomyces sp. NPDC057575]|uniref:hypothetical protein n=1 Tax=unclassified Streptomyces TaxID=2593676 RepID=UPI00368B21C3